MWILKNSSCERCGSEIIAVIPYALLATDSLVKDRVFREGDRVVSGATCQNCFKETILPIEPFGAFINEHCRRI